MVEIFRGIKSRYERMTPGGRVAAVVSAGFLALSAASPFTHADSERTETVSLVAFCANPSDAKHIRFNGIHEPNLLDQAKGQPFTVIDLTCPDDIPPELLITETEPGDSVITIEFVPEGNNAATDSFLANPDGQLITPLGAEHIKQVNVNDAVEWES